jgi:malonyl-CoA/methylmalonyl-CoA synthetase
MMKGISGPVIFYAAWEMNMSLKDALLLTVSRLCAHLMCSQLADFLIVILFLGYRIPIIELESSLMDLPYIAEAYVTAAPDHEARELAAAIVRLQKGCEDQGPITLSKVRKDLSQYLPTYKLPAILRVLDESEEIPRTASGKPIKRDFLKQFFGIQGFIPPGYSWPRTEYWGNQPEQVLAEMKPWDWCGLQRSD